ncbi:MAG: hypothetical protein ACLFXM_14210 [Acidimicrobiia bacterium]
MAVGNGEPPTGAPGAGAGGGDPAGDDPVDPDHDPGERARAAVDHLQAAARELIAAARAALDAADDLVNDREAMATAARTITSLGDLVRPMARRRQWPDETPGSRPAPPAGSAPGDERPAADERIQRIEVR